MNSETLQNHLKGHERVKFHKCCCTAGVNHNLYSARGTTLYVKQLFLTHLTRCLDFNFKS